MRFSKIQRRKKYKINGLKNLEGNATLVVRARVEAAASGDRGGAVDVDVDVGRSRLEDKV